MLLSSFHPLSAHLPPITPNHAASTTLLFPISPTVALAAATATSSPATITAQPPSSSPTPHQLQSQHPLPSPFAPVHSPSTSPFLPLLPTACHRCQSSAPCYCLPHLPCHCCCLHPLSLLPTYDTSLCSRLPDRCPSSLPRPKATAHPPPFISSAAQPPPSSSCYCILLLPPSQVAAATSIFLSSPPPITATNRRPRYCLPHLPLLPTQGVATVAASPHRCLTTCCHNRS
ncbi:hypothetical protein GW17_00054230 [Ensete ventricosum]|nr:hypothetical protein GW17_00054230 [Ensete ventricosum]RZS15985.1 hypothetical protein BHM03_00047915 [Ensete ventricosum]